MPSNVLVVFTWKEMIATCLLCFHVEISFVADSVQSILICASQRVFMWLGCVWWSPQKYCCEGHGESNCSLAQLAAAAEAVSPASMVTGCAGSFSAGGNLWGRGEEPWGKGYKTRCCFFFSFFFFWGFAFWPSVCYLLMLLLLYIWEPDGAVLWQKKSSWSCGAQLFWWNGLGS